MLTQKIERQPTRSTSTPPRSGPAAIDTPKTAPQTPMARARSLRSVNVLTMIDIATGLSIEPPRACSMRKPTSALVVGARLHSSDPRPKTARPSWNVRRRPKRSAIDPDSMSKLATTTV